MSRDKCGAAAAAGVMATVSQLAPAGVKVVAAMAMVRNSVGSNCYVADEIITSRAGVRLRVGNTDAEGRMVRRHLESICLFPGRGELLRRRKGALLSLRRSP